MGQWKATAVWKPTGLHITLINMRLDTKGRYGCAYIPSALANRVVPDDSTGSLEVIFSKDQGRYVALVPPVSVSSDPSIDWSQVDWRHSNRALANALGVSYLTVYRARQLWASLTWTPRFNWRGRVVDWSKSNHELAETLNISAAAVASARTRYGREAYCNE